MSREFYRSLAEIAPGQVRLTDEQCLDVLTGTAVDLLPLLNAAFAVRKRYVGQSVTLHVINNAQNGHCPEDCHYCAQARTSASGIEEYPLKSEDEFMAEARQAHERGAFRYCMVFAGRGPSLSRVKKLAGLIKRIKAAYPLQICVSSGLLDEKKAALLKEAGLDRLNHNLNTSERFYEKICSTHTYADRMATLAAAKKAGLELCSGVIVGMGEGERDIIELARTLSRHAVPSIPVNFFVPVPGTGITPDPKLTPEYGLRVLCLFRFLNPDAEIRVAAGREVYFRTLEAMTLYPANSVFIDGYLNTRGGNRRRTLQMIKDAGFTVESKRSVEDLLKEEPSADVKEPDVPVSSRLKDLDDLRPFRQRTSPA